MHVAHIYCIMDDCTVSMHVNMLWLQLYYSAYLPTERLFLPAFSFPPFTLCHCSSNAEFIFLNPAALWPFPFSLYTSLDSPLPHSSHPPPPLSLSLTTILLLPALSPALSHFLEAHLKSLIIRLSLCSTQCIINSTGAASRGFSLLF